MLAFKKGQVLDLRNSISVIKKPIPISAIPINEPFEVETLHGKVKGSSGNYIMIGPTDLYPIELNTLRDTYLPATCKNCEHFDSENAYCPVLQLNTGQLFPSCKDGVLKL